MPQPGGTVPRHALNSSASMRSKRSLHSTSSKKYPPEGGHHLSGHHTTNSYSLWSAQNSLKREHKRKFNRSLCGVLLGISIVLVILGILGIIGIAVYLGGKTSHYRTFSFKLERCRVGFSKQGISFWKWNQQSDALNIVPATYYQGEKFPPQCCYLAVIRKR